MDTKNVVVSRTIWTNAAALVVGSLSLAAGVDPSLVAQASVVLVPIVNMVLRFFTKTQITLK